MQLKILNMALIIYSGGLDSTVLLHKYAAQNKVKAAIGFNYGQKHVKELEFAKINCQKLGIPYSILDLSCISKVFGNSSLVSKTDEVPDGHYEADNMKSTVVPNRNMIMISIAAAKAISLGCKTLAYAAHSGDHAIYPDCRPQFAKALADVLKICDYSPLTLETPFLNSSKAEIVKEGNALGVDFSLCWSCYKGKDIHCGTCGTCTERKEAFKLAGIPDPTIYANK